MQIEAQGRKGITHQVDGSRTFARGDVPATLSEAGFVPVVGRLGRKGKKRRDEERAEDHDVVETRKNKIRKGRKRRRDG